MATLTTRLLDGGRLTTADVDRLETGVAAEVEAAVASAEAGTLEPVSDLTRFVRTRPEDAGQGGPVRARSGPDEGGAP